MKKERRHYLMVALTLHRASDHLSYLFLLVATIGNLACLNMVLIWWYDKIVSWSGLFSLEQCLFTELTAVNLYKTYSTSHLDDGRDCAVLGK